MGSNHDTSAVLSNIISFQKSAGLSWQELAEITGISTDDLLQIEQKAWIPGLPELFRLADAFGISLDQLVKTIDDRGKDSGSRSENPLSRTSQFPSVVYLTVDRDGRENIELVPVKAAAGYLSGYADPEYLEDLPHFRLPMMPQGTYRAFEISGDSMLPLKPGTIVIGEFVDSLEDIKSGETYVLLTAKEGIVYKRIQNNLLKDGLLSLESDNHTYPAYSVSPSEILEVWCAKAFISQDFPSTELTIEKLASIVMDLQEEVQHLKYKLEKDQSKKK